MAGRLQYGKRYKYPHMIGDDAIIWERFMNLFPERFETVDYDFRVGSGVPIPAGEAENYARMMTMLSQKRIDVIGWKNESPTIIEVKRRVGLGALGQVFGYRILFKKDFKNIKKPELLIVCEEITVDDRVVLEVSGVPVEVV